MPGGFTAPSILFLSTYDAPERAFAHSIIRQAHERYTRFVEPCAGGFAMPMVAVDAGYAGAQMECSDVQLFASTVGTYLADEPLDSLGVRVDGQNLPLTGSGASDASLILYTQLLLRMQAQPRVHYWLALIRDLQDRREQHVAEIETALLRMRAQLGRIRSFQTLDPFAHLDLVADDPTAIVSVNPPTYKGAYEKFYDTAGRLTWRQPEYDVFDSPGGDIARLVDRMRDAAALFICQEQKPPGRASHERPVYARHLAPGQNVYYVTNRPDEVEAMIGGIKVVRRQPKKMSSLGLPVLPPDRLITHESVVRLLPCEDEHASYYKELWLHRIRGGDTGGSNAAVLVDGFIAGIIGLSTSPVVHAYPGVPVDKRDALLMRFALGCPHHLQRTTRLATLLAIQMPTAQAVLPPTSHWALERATRILTVEMTRHPEVKGLRGLMKLINKKPDAKDGYRLSYAAPLGLLSIEECRDQWLKKEAEYQKSRSQTASTSSV